MDFGTGTSAGGFTLDPNAASGAWTVYVYDAGAANLAGGTFARPSAAAWHHFVVNMDRTLTGGTAAHEVYVDGSSVALGHAASGNPTGNFGSLTLYLMSRSGTSLFGAGRLAEVAIWGGIELSAANVTSLYNSGSGVVATSVQGGSLVDYWQLCGTASPEPATTGGINMTVTGATSTTHPISGASICGAATGVKHKSKGPF